MNNIIRTILITVLTLCLSFSAVANKTSKPKVLMVLSGYGQQQGEVTPGYEFDEFSKAYLVFKNNGIQVDVASPQGGKVEADKYDPNKPYNSKVIADSEAMHKLKHSLVIADLNASDYQGIFIVGGKGAMFDLPKDTALQSLIADIYQQNGSVAAVCHGPAALVNVKLNDGSYLVNDKNVNSFTNDEEKLFGKKWLAEFTFLLEDKLIARGAKFQSSEMMLSHVAVDERLITGQNPASTVAVATALVTSLGLQPAAFESFSDDKTLHLIAKILKGEPSAAAELNNNPSQYQMPLVGMYGYYYQQLAQTNAQLEDALLLMSLAQKDLNNSRLDMQIATVQHKLGKHSQSKATLEQILVTKPDFKPALEMLQTAF